MINDRTSTIERDVQIERKPKFIYLIRLFIFAFSSAKVISCLYLAVFITLSLLRPLLALVWGSYIQAIDAISYEETIFSAIMLIISYFVINFLCDLINRYVMPQEEIERLDVVQANRQQELLHSKIYSKLASILPETLEIPKVNDRIEQVFNFVGNRWNGMNTQVMLQSYIVIAKAVSVFTIALSLYILNPWLCLIVLAAPLPTLWSLTIGQRLQFAFIKDNTKLMRMAGHFQKMMISSAGKELKTLGLHDFFYKKWKRIADEYTLKEKKLIRTQAILNISNFFLLSLANVGGSVLAIILMAMGQLTLGALGAGLVLISTLVNDTKDLLTAFVTFMMKSNEAAQFFDLMELPEARNDGEKCNTIETIEVKNLKYRYPLTERYVLKGIDLRISKGEKIALVGENGMGKTTFVKLITGTLFPSDGKILINGNDVEDFNNYSRYGCLSTVVQNPARYFTFTISENVFLGDTLKPRDNVSINKALSFSGLSNMDKNSLLGKDIGGTDLSGGQWQKLAIARAMYRDRDLIVLDEPTSNLDPLAEAEIFQKYIELAKNKTVVFVTHRISIASLADRIIVFADGKIVQDGTHKELINSVGEYAQLYNEQAKWYDRK